MLQLYTRMVKYLYIMRQLDKPYLGNVWLTQPTGACLSFPRLN